MSLEWYCPTHELVPKTLGARVSTQVANLIMPVLSRRASSTSATVTIAHRIIFTYQKEVECRCACGRYLTNTIIIHYFNGCCCLIVAFSLDNIVFFELNFFQNG